MLTQARQPHCFESLYPLNVVPTLMTLSVVGLIGAYFLMAETPVLASLVAVAALCCFALFIWLWRRIPMSFAVIVDPTNGTLLYRDARPLPVFGPFSRHISGEVPLHKIRELHLSSGIGRSSRILTMRTDSGCISVESDDRTGPEVLMGVILTTSGTQRPRISRRPWTSPGTSGAELTQTFLVLLFMAAVILAILWWSGILAFYTMPAFRSNQA